jgi:hypothetical protein
MSVHSEGIAARQVRAGEDVNQRRWLFQADALGSPIGEPPAGTGAASLIPAQFQAT